MPKSEQSLNELLYDLKRIEEHREILSENKIRKIYKSLMKELNAFIAEEYFLYADGEGVLSYATLQEKAREAKFLEEVVRQVDSITPKIKAEMTSLVEETYTNCYQGMVNAVKNASNTQNLAAVITNTTLRPEVLKQAVNNNISKLTLPNVLEKHRQEIVYNIKQELTIGMINGDRYEQMARRITDKVDISYNKAMNIARTESHRNIESGLFDCAENISQGVEGSGLVYVAIWRTMKDERVRPNMRRKTKKGWKTYKSTNGADHVSMEGKTIRVGDFFEFSDGIKTKCPSKSGVARHDCNCRCFLEYDVMTEEEFAMINSKTSVKKVSETVANSNESDIIKLQDIVNNTSKLKSAMNDVDYSEYVDKLNNHTNSQIKKVYTKYADGVSNIEYGKSGYYSPSSNKIVFSYPQQHYIDNGMDKYSTLAHEYGHCFDTICNATNIHFTEIDLIHQKTKYGSKFFKKCVSSSDEFLQAVRKDGQSLSKIITSEVQSDLKNHDSSSGVQDAIDGLLGIRINWGHGDSYYNRKYTNIKKMNDHNALKEVYNELGFNLRTQAKVKKECRVYETSSEIWANIMAAEVNGGEALEYVKKYLPNSYEAMLEILKGV